MWNSSSLSILILDKISSISPFETISLSIILKYNNRFYNDAFKQARYVYRCKYRFLISPFSLKLLLVQPNIVILTMNEIIVVILLHLFLIFSPCHRPFCPCKVCYIFTKTIHAFPPPVTAGFHIFPPRLCPPTQH